MAEPIYKIVAINDWANARKSGQLTGTPVDIADGYIHFSTVAQLAETLEKHYRPIPIADPIVLRTYITKHLAHLSFDRDFRFSRIPINFRWS